VFKSLTKFIKLGIFGMQIYHLATLSITFWAISVRILRVWVTVQRALKRTTLQVCRLVRFQNKNIFLNSKNALDYLLQCWRCSCKGRGRRIGRRTTLPETIRV
jgi:hypothetical protein